MIKCCLLLMSFKGIDPRKALILLKWTWYFDPRIKKFQFLSLTYSKAAVQRCYAKKLFWKFSKNSQKSIRGGNLFQLSCWLKGPHHGCFPVNSPNFFRTAFLLSNFGQLLLYIDILKEISFRIKTRKHTVDFS